MYANCVHKDYYIELHFHSDKSYDAPGEDVLLDVIFTNETQQSIKVPAFWNGQQHWVVRYSSRMAGKHTYLSECNDTNNQQLHHVTGELVINPYNGTNPLLKHGAPIVATDKRHFCHEDGTPFFWLGDTWWMGLCQRLSWPIDFQKLAKDRQKKHFNVIQLVAGLYPDMEAFDLRAKSESGFCWEIDFKQVNPAFFDEADKRINHLVSLGITPCIVGCWGYYLQTMGVDKMKQHWRYLMARWGALPVVWVASGEQTMPWYLSKQKEKDSIWLKQSWTQVMTYMREINVFNRMMTTHPVKTARSSVLDITLLDFDMQQTDHHAETSMQAAQALSGWFTKPVMPVISGESRYEALAVLPKVTTEDVRQAFWAHSINSGLAGHTYGANGIWQANTQESPFGKSPNGHHWGNLPWQTAMALPGAKQLAVAKEILETIPWHQFEPVQSMFKISNNSKWRIVRRLKRLASSFSHWQLPVAAAISQDHLTAIYYTLQQKKIKVQTKKTVVSSIWIDPINGSKMPAQPYRQNRHESIFLTPPPNAANAHDWLLLIHMQ